MIEKEVASYISMHSNSLIKNLTPFEDDAEMCLLNYLMWSICKQREDTSIKKMASLKIDFYFEVFQLFSSTLKFLKSYVELSHSSNIA